MSRKKTNHKIFENITVIDVGSQGKAVAKAPDGRVIFLTNAVPGDIVDVQTGRQRKSYYEGKVIKYHHYSDKRAKPICEHFDVCGGCKWQNLGYEYQLYHKENEVVNNLKRIGHLELPEVTPIFGAKEHYYYRNKMEFSFSSNRWLSYVEIENSVAIENRNACGFHIAGMWDKILDINFCHLQKEPSNAIRNFVKHFAIENDISFFNPKTLSGMMRTIMIRITSINEIMVVVQFFENNKRQIELIMNALASKFPEITSLQYIINGKQNDTIYDQEIILFKGRNHIFEEMEGLKFKINAKSFYQTNSVQAYELYKITRDFAAIKNIDLVYDLYTGTGTIAQFISKNAKKVIGIESVPEAILDAKQNAIANKIDNVDFFVGDMKSVFTEEFINKNGTPNIIITDPPRDGMHKDVVAQLLTIRPKKIVYVSCNSATQARDLALMKDDYKITKTQAVDMFPQTHHVENVVLLELK
ncbi:MAG: 23S rRNA (uracil(1939)-C(5))-methyltransferase RlmD [Bacteroidetes bacterium]|nr:23S rRNA (uracil(1939)-C(5))-methyltransferase RlmD [Bacteroidota bacterium]